MTCMFRSLLAVLLLLGVSAQAAVIDFEDLAHGTDVTNQYAGSGVTFTPTHFSVVGGLAEGDPGNWGLQGTNGSHFLGFNGNPTYHQTMTFSLDIFSISMDVARSNGSSAGNTFTLEGYLNGFLQASQTIVLGAINSWTTIGLTGTFDEIVWVGDGSGFHPYGVDNIEFSAAVPSPSTLAIMLIGLVVMLRRRALMTS